MKRRDLINKLVKAGWYIKRKDGGNHEVWTDGKHTEPIPRHREINEQLAKDILKKYGLK